MGLSITDAGPFKQTQLDIHICFTYFMYIISKLTNRNSIILATAFALVVLSGTAERITAVIYPNEKYELSC